MDGRVCRAERKEDKYLHGRQRRATREGWLRSVRSLKIQKKRGGDSSVICFNFDTIKLKFASRRFPARGTKRIPSDFKRQTKGERRNFEGNTGARVCP